MYKSSNLQNRNEALMKLILTLKNANVKEPDRSTSFPEHLKILPLYDTCKGITIYKNRVLNGSRAFSFKYSMHFARHLNVFSGFIYCSR